MVQVRKLVGKMMLRIGWFLLYVVLGSLFHSTTSQPLVNLPVRPEVTELGLLQGRCPSPPVSPTSGLHSGSGRPSGSGSGSGFLCMSVDVAVGAFCAIALRERVCPFQLYTCSMCTELSMQCGPLSGDIDTVCAGASSVCSTLDTQQYRISSGVLAYLCDFCGFVQENCLMPQSTSRVLGSCEPVGEFSGASGSGALVDGLSGVSGNGFSSESATAVSGSGVSGSDGGESGSGDVCFNLFRAVGAICATVLQADLCPYNYSSQTCTMCDDLVLLCGQPEGDIATFCDSEMAQNCSEVIHTAVASDSFEYCPFVWSMCYLGTEVEHELCAVEGLVEWCTNLLSNMYQCECFLPSSQCSLCTSVVSICEPPPTTLPGATVDVNDLTPEQAENSVTIVFAGITVVDFIANELQFRVAIADIVNRNLLTSLPPDRPKRQSEAMQNVAAENVFIVGPSPLLAGDGLQVVFFVQTNDGALINGTELTEAVQSEGPTLAEEVGATEFRAAFEGVPMGLGQPQPTGQPTILLPSATSTMAVQTSSAIFGKPQQPTPPSSQRLQPTDSITATTETVQPTMTPPPPTETAVTGELSEGSIAAIVVLLSIAVVVVLVVSAVVLYCVQRRRRKYSLRIGSGSKYYGKYIHATNTFGRPSITSDTGRLTEDDMPMEKKLATLPFTAVVATNPVALEPDVEIFMIDKSGEFRQNGDTEVDLLEESTKDTQL